MKWADGRLHAEMRVDDGVKILSEKAEKAGLSVL